MKTHQLSRALRTLSDILENGQDVELNKKQKISYEKKLDASEVAVSLQTLLKLSKFSKQDWIKLIKYYNFDISIREKDSSRDILGKLLNYLDSNPKAVDSLKKKAMKKRKDESPLMQALDLLLRGD